MTVIAKPLITAQDAPNAQTTLYTAPAGTRAILDKCTAYNHTGAPADLSVNLVPNGGAAAAANLVVKVTIAAGTSHTCPEVVGHTLETGGFISILSSVATALCLRVSGREVS